LTFSNQYLFSVLISHDIMLWFKSYMILYFNTYDKNICNIGKNDFIIFISTYVFTTCHTKFMRKNHINLPYGPSMLIMEKNSNDIQIKRVRVRVRVCVCVNS